METTRRNWLKLCLAIMASTPVWAHGMSETISPTSKANGKKKVIVVGAGLAGLAAARSLHQAGYAVQILEAREHVGAEARVDGGRRGSLLLWHQGDQRSFASRTPVNCQRWWG